jgi:hypothetical protein
MPHYTLSTQKTTQYESCEFKGFYSSATEDSGLLVCDAALFLTLQMIVMCSSSGLNSPLHPADEGTIHSFDTSGTRRRMTQHHTSQDVESPLLININF